MNALRTLVLRHRQWVLFATIVVGGFVITSSLVSSSRGSGAEIEPAQDALASRDLPESNRGQPLDEKAAIGAGAPVAAPPIRGSIRSYSIPLHEISGLPNDLKGGSVVELWVAWERPFTRGPRVQPLLRRAVFERIAPPLTPEGSPVAVFAIPSGRLPDLVFADRWGAISVATY